MNLEQACARFEEAVHLAYPQEIKGERLAKVRELFEANPPANVSWSKWRNDRFPFLHCSTMRRWLHDYDNPSDSKGPEQPVDFQDTPQYMERCLNRTLEFAEGYAKNFNDSKRRGFYAALSRRFQRAIDGHYSTPKTSVDQGDTGAHQHGSAGALRKVHNSPGS